MLLQELQGLRGQVEALQDEVRVLQEESARLQAELVDAAAARKEAEASARENSVAMKQKDAELALVRTTRDNDMQRKDETIRKLQVGAWVAAAKPRLLCAYPGRHSMSRWFHEHLIAELGCTYEFICAQGRVLEAGVESR